MLKLRRSCLVPLAVFALLSQPAVAKERPEWRSWPLGARITAAIGYYDPKLETKGAVSDANGNLGALISFEDTLGLSDNEGTAIGFLNWRISKRNALGLNYFKLNRSASQDSTIVIAVANPSPPPDFLQTEVTLPISAKFNIQSLDITYTFSPIFTERHNLGIGLGLALQELEFGYQASENCESILCEQFGPPRIANSTAPLPTLKLVYQYAINDKWIVDTSIGYFALDLELDTNENIDGSLWNVGAGIRWKAWEHAGFSLGYKYFDVDLGYEKRNLAAKAIYKYQGFVVGADAFF